MFVRTKKSGKYQYLQIVQNRREGKKTVQRVIATLGRLDRLQGKGEIESIIKSLARFADARFDGKWVLKTNTSLSPEEVALKYKELWMVEQVFRDVKSVLETRPVFHQRDETIRGHVFLALMLRKELECRWILFPMVRHQAGFKITSGHHHRRQWKIAHHSQRMPGCLWQRLPGGRRRVTSNNSGKLMMKKNNVWCQTFFCIA